MVFQAPRFSNLIFGRPDATFLVVILALSLAAVVLHHFLEALFAALRKFSIVSTMHFCQSMSFAIISLALIWFWQFAAESIVIGYGAACLLSAVVRAAVEGRGGAGGSRATTTALPTASSGRRSCDSHFGCGSSTCSCHLFGVVDRYMLVHFSGLENAAALALVGHYHASRIVPVLFLSVADLLAGAVMPYLSHDWEIGASRNSLRSTEHRSEDHVARDVRGRRRRALDLRRCCSMSLSQGRYDEGLAVMPWTLTYCVWYSLLLVAQNYLWCAEKARLGVLPLVVGLVAQCRHRSCADSNLGVAWCR